MSELLAQEFFAPADTDLIDTLIGQYRAELAKLDRICDVMTSDGLAAVMRFFISGNGDERERYSLPVDNQFAGTSVSVVMLTATRECTPRPPR